MRALWSLLCAIIYLRLPGSTLGDCALTPNTLLAGSFIANSTAASVGDCCSKCQLTSACTHFSYCTGPGSCLVSSISQAIGAQQCSLQQYSGSTDIPVLAQGSDVTLSTGRPGAGLAFNSFPSPTAQTPSPTVQTPSPTASPPAPSVLPPATMNFQTPSSSGFIPPAAASQGTTGSRLAQAPGPSGTGSGNSIIVAATLPQPSSASTGVIVGASVGGAAGLALLILAVLMLRRRQRKTRDETLPYAITTKSFEQPEAQMDLELKGSETASGVLIDFDIAVAKYKSINSKAPAASAARPPSVPSPGSSKHQDSFSLFFVDVQEKYGTKNANLPKPGHQPNRQNVAEGIQSISLSDEFDDAHLNGLDDTWKIEPADLQCRMLDGKPAILGKGGFGAVYLGVLHREEVAIKVVTSHTERQHRRFLREIKTLRACTNPNIVQFIGACVRERHTFMVMEYMDGGDLFSRLSSDVDGNFGWYKRGSQVALDIARGLIYLHSKQIAHLDLKSPNVMLTATGKAKLGDVGLGKLVASTKQLATHEGTYLWSAPEQLLGLSCGTASDIFSFGTVLWEICSHELPESRALRPLRIPEEAPSRMADIINMCHQAEMDARPTATTVYDMLQALLR